MEVGGNGGGAGSGGTGEPLPVAGQLPPLTVQELDVDALPIIYDIIRCVEREQIDNAAKARESQDCSQKVLELHEKLESARAQIRRLRGVDFNKREQLRRLEVLRRQLRLKRELLQKYRSMCAFDAPPFQ